MRSSLTSFAIVAALVASRTSVVRAQSQIDETPPLDSAPATQPATAPLTDAQINQGLAALSSADAAQREDARVQLMGMPHEQLPVLHQILERLQPISPSAAASLHQIVLQVYLADEPYPCNRSNGFLGLRWGDSAGLQESPRLGVPVGLRLPGFPSFRLLRTGDLILGLLVVPTLPLQQAPNVPTPDLGALQNAVSEAGSSHQIVLEVLRQGERVQLPVTLSPKLSIPPEEVDAFADQRRTRAEAYWRETFMPLIRPGLS